MKVVKIASAAALAFNLVGGPINVFASTNPDGKSLVVSAKDTTNKTIASVKRFDLYGKNISAAYNEVFKMPNTNIKSITNNGGKYYSSTIDKAIDGDMNTHWETGKPNSATFTNEVVINFNEATTLNRIVYAARQESTKGKGFAQQFEIYSSTSDSDNDFTLVTSGEYTGSTGDIVEIQFTPTEFKRVKFVFKKANQDWASAAEFQFYKEDTVRDKMDTLFTDHTYSTVSDSFNTIEALNKLETEAQEHPLYSLYKEDIENAKAILNAQKIEATTAVTKSFTHYSNEAYSTLFKMDNQNIASFSNNGKHYWDQVIDNAFDGNINTYWETNTSNTTNFFNTVEVNFKEAVTLNRIVYGARPSDRKGFAEEFEIYGSTTSKGDTYELVAMGKHNMVSGLVEAKFEPTTFKRVKFVFKKSNQNWATLSELAFYKEDKLDEKISNLFTDGTMSAVSPEYNSLEKINALEEEAKDHPLYDTYKESLDLAKKLVKGEVVTEGNIIVAEQHGNMVKHANENLKIGLGNNLQPTGLAAQPGDQIIVYVDAATDGPLPNLVFSQQEGAWNSWRQSVSLKIGKNVITVPSITKTAAYNKAVTPGGTIYIENPYTQEQQAKAPKLRFEGAERIPYATKDTNVEEFKQFLIDYKKKIDEDIAKHPNVADREVLDIVEVVSDHLFWTGTATGAYKTYIEDGYSPLQTIESYNNLMDELFKYNGLDARSEKHDPKYIRENVRLAQPYAYMYAAGDHIGTLDDVVSSMLVPFEDKGGSWGLIHEIGHRMDIGVRTYGEVTNNMLPQYMSSYYGKIDQRIPFESHIYQNVLKENTKDYNSQGLFEKLAVYWQLEMYSPGYWGKLNSLYRERNVTLTNGDSSKQQYLVEFSSEALGLDLSEHFARHGFVVTDETKEKTSKYPKPDKKIWYLNNSAAGYNGNGMKGQEVKVTLISNESTKTNTLNLSIDNTYKNDFLGYEIFRDGELIGFTSTSQFIDKNVDISKNYTYKVIGYDKKLNTLKPVEIKAFTPTLAVEEYVTVKLHEAFDPMHYVKAISYNGQDITKNIVIKTNTVDTTKKGKYEVVYEIDDEGIKETRTVHVTVTSDYSYVSDMNAKSANVQYGGLKKDTATPGTPITLVRQGLDAIYAKGIAAHANSEVVYDIEGKDFDFFESYIGIDQNVKGKGSSATFEVWIDGEKKYDSKVFKSNTEHEFVKVPVKGAKEVKLVTTDANDNSNSFDHTVWADAKFTKNSSVPTLTVSEDLTMVKLNSDFDLLNDVTASDIEDGDLKQQVQVTANGFTTNKTGTYTIEYAVTDSDNNVATASKTIYVYSDEKYVSDISWKSAQTEWSTVNKDKASSGGSIKVLVNGEKKEFAKGIGTHANSTIVYDLTGKNFDYFETLVGVDQNIPENNNSSVTFKILADGQEVYNSGVMKYNTEAKLVRIPLKGVNELTLIANDSNNSISSDHANFANAKFYISNGLPMLTVPKDVATKVGTPINIKGDYSATDAEDGDLTSAVQVTGIDQVNFNRTGKYVITYTVTDSDGNEVTKKQTISVVDMNDYHYLSDFDWKSMQYSYAAPVKDISISHNKIRLTGEDGSVKTYEKGIGAHSNSTIVYDLTDKDADYFTAFVGVDRQMYGSIGSVIFQVFVDGEKQFDSGLMNSRDPEKYIEVDISGAKELKLIVTDGGNGNGSDHASWGDAKLHFANPDRVFTQDLEAAIEEAKAINVEDYTDESVTSLQASVAQAEAVLANEKATQADIDQALEMLKQAKEELVTINLSQIVTVPDTLLNKSIKQTLGITDEITLADMHKLTSLSVPTSRTERVTSLEGLQYAKNLESLNIAGNEVTDFSPLQGLKKLVNLMANPQVIEMPSPTGQDSIFHVENLVKGLDGKYVNPTQIGLRHNKTFKEISIDVNQFAPNADHFTMDLSEEDKGFYTLVLVYEIEGNLIQLMSIIHNN